ncbi:MAG: hypothetical protein ACE5MH_08135, partial [Terriglobia bacterium]
MKKQLKSSDTGGGLLRDARLARYPWLLHAFTMRQNGNLSYGVAACGAVEHNRSQFLKALLKIYSPSPQAPAWGESFRLVTLRQRHS